MELRPSSSVEVCILAGGLSRRMGRDKSRLRLGRRTLLSHISAEASKLGFPVRVIRRDAVPRCGPLGGIYTALKSTRTDAVMFLACDMPFVSAALLCAMHRRFGRGSRNLFVRSEAKVGFPFILRRDALAVVTAQIEQDSFSLHDLARMLKAKTLRIPPGWRPQLCNINTPAEWRHALRLWRSS